MVHFRLALAFSFFVLCTACGNANPNLAQEPDITLPGEDDGEAQQEEPFPYSIERGRENVPESEQISISNLNFKTMVKITIPHAEERNAVCNDGTPGIFYARPGKNSDQWVIFLEGGSYCNSVEDCTRRQETQTRLTSSAQEPNSLNKNGIFDAENPANPVGDANFIYVHYCTSDAYWASVDAEDSPMPGFSFHGHDILDAIIEDLQTQKFKNMPDLDNATKVIFGGVSAGGGGALHYLPFLADRLPLSVKLFGIIDSAGGEINTFNNIMQYEMLAHLPENSDKQYLSFTSKLTKVLMGNMDAQDYLNTLKERSDYYPVYTDNGYLLGIGEEFEWSKKLNKHYYPPCLNRAAKENIPLSLCNNNLYSLRDTATPIIYFGALEDHYILETLGIAPNEHDKYADAVNQFGHDKIEGFLRVVRPQDALFLFDDTFHGGLHSNKFYGAINDVTFARFLPFWLRGENPKNIAVEHPQKYGFEAGDFN